jgi:hypothetical protein
MSARLVIEWEPCAPFGERAVIVNTHAPRKGNRVQSVLGYVWPKGRFFFASKQDGKTLGPFLRKDQAQRRIIQGQVLHGEPVLVRSKG